MAVHPHVRGEYAASCLTLAVVSGSSPRAWGIRTAGGLHSVQSRFIPTCVGNTAFSISSLVLRSVHPHVRGEYSFSRPFAQMYVGSSPRAWGIQHSCRAVPVSSRFIPTCVGNTYQQTTVRHLRPVHPHVRGEYRCQPVCHTNEVGSSPRAWGIPSRRSEMRLYCRFIPTCVGNT